MGLDVEKIAIDPSRRWMGPGVRTENECTLTTLVYSLRQRFGNDRDNTDGRSLFHRDGDRDRPVPHKQRDRLDAKAIA